MDNSYFHGSDSYVGHCPICGGQTGTNHDEPCEDCFMELPVKCPKCEDYVHPDHFTSHGCCIVCLEQAAEDITEKTLIIIEMMEDLK